MSLESIRSRIICACWVLGYKVVDDGGAGGGIALCVLFDEGYSAFAEFFDERVHETVRCGVKHRVGHLLADTDGIGTAAAGCEGET